MKNVEDEGMESKPTVPEVQPIVDAFYAIGGNSVGGHLHVVLDDENVHDDHVRYCIEDAESAGDERAAALGRLLLRMSRTQRKKLSRCVQDQSGIDNPEATFDALLAALDRPPT